MSASSRKLNTESGIALAGTVALGVVLVLGWYKQQFGLNFIDEGMYLVDGWRMAAGDSLFPDNSISVRALYTVFNALVFMASPDITLLGFRHLAFAVSVLSTGVLCAAFYKWTGEFWYLPFVAAGFGGFLAPQYLSYDSYPSHFLMLHVAALLFAFSSGPQPARRNWFLLAGLFLWGIGFSNLPLAVAYVSPVILWFAARKPGVGGIEFTGRELALVLLPGAVLGLAFLAYYNTAFLSAALDHYRFQLEDAALLSRTGDGAVIAAYVLATALFLGALLWSLRLGGAARQAALAVAVSVMTVLVYTNAFGLLPRFWQGWFDATGWFISLTLIAVGGFAFLVFRAARAGAALGRTGALVLVAFIPWAVIVAIKVNMSTAGVLQVGVAPALVALCVTAFAVDRLKKASRGRAVLVVAVLALLVPYGYALGWQNWRWTFFDFPPRHAYMVHAFSDGFLAGIKTNRAYGQLAEWIQSRARTFSKTGDFALAIEAMPMVYMLARRRPAIHHSQTNVFSKPRRADAVAQMIRDRRFPKIAFRFLRNPFFFPYSLREEIFVPWPGEFKYDRREPLNGFIEENMKLVETFSTNGQPLAEFYVSNQATPMSP